MSQDDDMSGDWNDAVMVCLLWWFMEFVVARGDFVQKSRSNSSSKAVAEKLKNNVSAGIQLVNSRSWLASGISYECFPVSRIFR